MNPIKKFSSEVNQPKSILESIDSKALTELINGMGFKDIHELKKEKALLSKLEALLKEVSPKEDVSEDDSKEIEDEIQKKGEPKSLEGETPTKIADVPTDGIDSEEEEEEESEEEAEAADAKKEVKEEAKTTPKATRKVMTFEDFIQEETVTVNKNVSYRDDEDDEDEAVPVADSEVVNINIEDEEENETVVKETSSSDKRAIRSFNQFVSEAYLSEEADNGSELKDEELSADNTVVSIAKGDGAESAAEIAAKLVAMGKPKKKNDKEGEALVTKDQVITEDPETAKNEVDIQGKVVVTAVTESHFKVGDTVEMSHGGTGVIFSLDKEHGADDEKYYNVKLPNGDMHKHAPNELTKVMTPIAEGKVTEAKEFSFTFDYNTDEDDIAYIQNVLKKAGVNATAGVELDSEEMVVKAANAIELRKAKKAIVADGFQINEAKEIKSDADFKEYADAILKKAFGDDFDEAKAKEVVDGLTSKYSGDYGAMVGALQASMGS